MASRFGALFFILFLLSSTSFADSKRFEQFTTAPERQVGSQNYANTYDVARCAALAEGIAVFGWYAQPVLSGIGGSSEWMGAKLAAVMKSSQAAKGVELILVTVTGYNIGAISNMTVGTFWDKVVAPQVEACKRVGFDYWEGIRSLPDLISQPDFFTPHEYDGPGIKAGRTCAEANLGYTRYNFFGGGLEGCMKCCDNQVRNNSALRGREAACQAVCNAQYQ